MVQNKKRIISLILMLTLLVSSLVIGAITASAADTTITFALGTNGTASHSDSNSAKTTYSETVEGYTLNITGGEKMYPGSRDAKGNSCIKLGASGATGSFSFTVPNDVTEVKISIANYKDKNTSVKINDTSYSLTKLSNNGEYDVISVDTSSTKTVKVATVSGDKRAMVNTIEFVIAGGGTVVHSCENKCSTCGGCLDALCNENACATKCQGHTVTPSEPETPEPPSDEWRLVTNASALSVGDQIVIVGAKDQNYYALSTTQNKNNRGQADVTKNDNTVTFGDNVQIITLKAGNADGTFAFYVEGDSTGYLYAASNSSNYLRTQTNNDDNGSWTIFIDADGIATIKAQGTNGNNLLKYNGTSSLFSCYASGQQEVSIYKLTDADACDHSDTTTTTVEAKCNESGSVTVTCNVCKDYSYTEVIPATGKHTYVCGKCSVCTAEQPDELTGGVIIAEYAAANGWKNDSDKYSTIKIDEYVTASAPTNGNNGKYFTNGENYRLYQYDGGTITIACSNNGVIKSVKITYTVANTGVLQLNGANIASEESVTVNAKSITFSVGNTGDATNGQVRITEIEVVYDVNTHTMETVFGNGATCTETGLTDGVKCSVCQATLTAQEVIPATGHSYDKTGACVCSDQALVAINGSVKYDSLQKAFDEAKTGDEITLYADVALDYYLNIWQENQAARAITLDLNGCTISASANYTYQWYPLVFVGVNQTLTIKGEGKITAKDKVTVGVYGKIVINDVNVVIENEMKGEVAGEDSALCIWSWDPNEDDGDYDYDVGGSAEIGNVTVKGEIYIEEGTNEQNKTIVNITGGDFSKASFVLPTLNFDKLVDLGYAEVQDNTIVLNQNVTIDSDVVVTNGMTIDLNGKTLTTKATIVFNGQIKGAGYLVVDKGNFSVLNGATLTEVPVKLSATEATETFVFRAVEDQQRVDVGVNDEGVTTHSFVFKPSFAMKDVMTNAELFGTDGTYNNNISFGIIVSRTNANGTQNSAIIPVPDTLVYGTNKAFKMTLTGVTDDYEYSIRVVVIYDETIVVYQGEVAYLNKKKTN